MRYMAMAILLATLAILAGCGASQGPQAGKGNNKPACTEDMPCWNCSTMGNRKCGSKYLFMPEAVRRATEQGWKCWLEQDVSDSTGITYLGWYCADKTS